MIHRGAARRRSLAAALAVTWFAVASVAPAPPPVGHSAPKPAIKAPPRSTIPSRAALPSGRKPAELARNARLLEELGAYARAAAAIKKSQDERTVGVCFGTSGPGATNHFEAGGFVRGDDTVAYPNLMFHFLSRSGWTAASTDGAGT